MSALILVDLQNDFFPGGTLAVKEGDAILPAVNELIRRPFDVIVATKDWHPKNHISFADTHGKKVGEGIDQEEGVQILWPIHCVENTKGAEFAKGWDTGKVHKVIYKGTDPAHDSYSTFFDNGHKKSTGLDAYLKEKGIRKVVIVGLATDYCVKYSALDAVKLGFKVYVVKKACQGVNLHPGDVDKALAEMDAAGVKIV